MSYCVLLQFNACRHTSDTGEICANGYMLTQLQTDPSVRYTRPVVRHC